MLVIQVAVEAEQKDFAVHVVAILKSGACTYVGNATVLSLTKFERNGIYTVKGNKCAWRKGEIGGWES